MDAAARPFLPDSPSPVFFEDGLGQRTRHAEPAGGSTVEVLRLRASFATVPSFEFALRERVGRLAGFSHPAFVRVRGVERGGGDNPVLSVVSDAVSGLRLSSIVAGAHARRVPLDIYAALCLIRQLVTSVATLHDRVPDIAHGTLAPERLIVTSRGRLIVAEPVLGAAIEQLRLPCERYWRELRVAVPSGPARACLDARTDVLQLGVIALSLVLGRPLRDDEFPLRVDELVSAIWAVSPRGGFEPLPPGLRGWLARALQLDTDRAFATPIDASAGLCALLGDSELMSSPASLEAFLTRYRADETLSPALTAAAPMRQPMVVEALSLAESPKPAAPPRLVAPPTTLSRRDSAVTLVEARADALESRRSGRWTQWKQLAAAAALLGIAGAGGTVAARRLGLVGTALPPGTLELKTRPATVDAFIDGERRGATPLLVRLDAGTHTVELRGAAGQRRLQLTINPGMKVTQYVDLTSRAGQARRAAPRQR